MSLEALLQPQPLRVKHRQLLLHLQYDKCGGTTRSKEPQGLQQEAGSCSCACGMQRAGIAEHNELQALVQV